MTTSRRRSRLARIAIGTGVVAAGLAATAWAVLSLPPFGAPMADARLARAQANLQYRDGRFINVQPETPTSWAAVGDYLVRQFSGDEVREPPAPLPVLAIDPAALAAAPAPGVWFWLVRTSEMVGMT